MKICLLAATIAAAPQTAVACSVCYGNPDSALGDGARWGVLAMIVIIACVLSGIGAFFVFLGKRSADLMKSDSSASSSELTDGV